MVESLGGGARGTLRPPKVCVIFLGAGAAHYSSGGARCTVLWSWCERYSTSVTVRAVL